MKKRTLISLALTSLLIVGCETGTTSVSSDGKVDTVFIKESDKVLWGLLTYGIDSTKDEVGIGLMGSSSLNEIPRVEINGQDAIIDGNDLDDVIEAYVEYYVDKNFKVGETINFKTFVTDDTLTGSVVVPPRITALKCNGKSVADTAKTYKGNLVTISKGIESLIFTWDLPNGYDKTVLSGDFYYRDTTNNYKRLWWGDTLVSGSSFVLNIPTDFVSLDYGNFSFWLTNSKKMEMGDTPTFQSELQNMYTEVYGPEWHVKLEME